jgi:hypothetical protein
MVVSEYQTIKTVTLFDGFKQECFAAKEGHAPNTERGKYSKILLWKDDREWPWVERSLLRKPLSHPSKKSRAFS